MEAKFYTLQPVKASSKKEWLRRLQKNSKKKKEQAQKGTKKRASSLTFQTTSTSVLKALQTQEFNSHNPRSNYRIE